MFIIEIAALENGAHRNQNGSLSHIPDGWAVVPNSIEIPDTFPFVNIKVDGQTVVSMTAGVVPEPEPIPEPEPTQLDIIEAQVTYTAMMTNTLVGGVTDEHQNR